MTSLAQYDAARAALAAATRIDEILPLRAQMEHLKLHAKHVQDKELMADAADIQIRAEAKLGFLLIEAERSGHIRQGRPKKGDPENPTNSEGFTLKEIGVSHRLSADSQQKASISEQALEAMIAGVRQRITNGRAKIIEEVDRADEKKQARDNRERVLGVLQRELPDKKFGVILADPEWRFKTYSRETGMDRAADNHYPTSETDAICARPVGDIAAKDCVLFLWATAPMLPDALRVMAAWGFEYKSHLIWKKDRIGTGYWFRNQHELLLVGTKGDKIPAPAMGTQFPSVIDAPIGKHSEKPDAFYDLIERYFPTLPKIELNARRSRDGWESWGNEAPEVPPHDPETGEVIEVSPLPDEVDVSSEATEEIVSRETPAPQGFLETQGPIDESGSIAEFFVLRAVADFCFPDRENLLLRFAGDYIAQRLVVFVSHRGDWTLTESGRARLRELQAEREPPPAADGPALDDDERARFAALKEIQAGRQVHGNIARDLVGVGYLHCTTERLFITEEGLAWLLSIENPSGPEPQQVDIEELIPAGQSVDLPLFLAGKETA